MSLADDLREALAPQPRRGCILARSTEHLSDEDRAALDDYIEAIRIWRATRGPKVAGGPSNGKLRVILRQHQVTVGAAAISDHVEGRCSCVSK